MQLGEYGRCIIEQYLAEVRVSLKGVPSDDRQVICNDLRTHIEQALQATGGDRPNAADLHGVLAGLGDPADYTLDLVAPPVSLSNRVARWLTSASGAALVALLLAATSLLGPLGLLSADWQSTGVGALLWLFTGAGALALGGFALGREWRPGGSRPTRVLAAIAIALPVSMLLFGLMSARVDKPRFHSAARAGDFGAVENHLRGGADANAKDWHGRTALHDAALMGHAEVVELMLKAGADVNAKGSDGETPLHWAAKEGCPEVARLLLEHNADLSPKDRFGQTPLQMAARRGHDDLVELLGQHTHNR